MRSAVVRPIDLPPGRRCLVISDIHGNLPLLKGLLHKARFSPDDILIVLGDIMERSLGSLDTLRYVMKLTETHTVYSICGNCDDITPNFVYDHPDVPAGFYEWWFSRSGERCAWVKMAHLAGVPVETPADYPAARKAIAAAFPKELAFLRNLPQILLHDNYLFVHGGVPRETRLEELSAQSCMKNDFFLEQNHRFRRWVIVGHTPVTLYHRRIPDSNPILLSDRHIASIDGGCTLNHDGQLNALILPPEPGGNFSWVSFDGFPVFTALDAQEASPDPISLRWNHSALEVLEYGTEFSRCRHLESGRVLDILTEFLRRDEKGGVSCAPSTDYHLPVSPGEQLSLLRRTSRGALVKKDGMTGWYRGRLA